MECIATCTILEIRKMVVFEGKGLPRASVCKNKIVAGQMGAASANGFWVEKFTLKHKILL